MIDDLGEDRRGVLHVLDGSRDSALVVFRDDGEEYVQARSVEDYITIGASNGFAWRWQLDPGRTVDDSAPERYVKRLRPLATPANPDLAALASALVARGATVDEARSLVEWLGADVIVLIA